MKNVIFCVFAMLVGSLSFAQVTPNSPMHPTTIANMSSNPNANTGKSVQNGDGQRVLVQQVGTNQSAESNQDNGTGLGGNLAFIQQIGAVNSNSGHLNVARVDQKGSSNESTQLQEGDENHAYTKQGLNNTASSGNKAWTQQGTNEQAEGNVVEVNQDGDDNQSRTKQTYDHNEALTTQNGIGNKSDIRQIASPNHSQGHAAEVNQDGVGNQALVHQDGNGSRNEATTLQLGDGNSAVQNQFATGSSNDGNNAFISQGNVYVGGSSINNDLFWNGLSLIDDASFDVFATGSTGAIARQEQTGTNNVAATYQTGELNQAYQYQNGDDNRGLIVQNVNGGGNSTVNRARQEQSGNDNDAGIYQNGTNQRAYQIQDGDHNRALSTQKGHDNWVNTNQFGNNNYVTTGQRGECNQALVNQYDGQSYSLEQNLDGASGGHNQANILQQGPGGTATGDIHCNVPNVDPGTFNPIGDLNIPDLCPGCGGN